MTAFLVTQDTAGLFTVAAAFGLGFTGIIPAYVLAVRELFPASEALLENSDTVAVQWIGHGHRWLVRRLAYDHFDYAPLSAAGIGANILNLLVIGMLVGRQRYRAAYA